MATCAFLRAKLAQTVAGLRPSGAVEKGIALVKAGYLGSGKTIMRNFVGNAATWGTENFVRQPIAATADYLTSIGRSALTGFHVPPSEFRSIPFPSIAQMQWGAKGFTDGLRSAIDYMRTGVDPEYVNQKWDLQQVNFNSPALQRAVSIVYDLMEAGDKPWYGLSYQMSLANSAEVAAIKEGLHGAAKTDRVNQLLARPTDEMHLRATRDAQYATFKNKTALGQAAAGLKRALDRAGSSGAHIAKNPESAAAARLSGKALYALSEVNLPFTSVPTAMAGVFVDYSLLGVIKTIASQFSPELRTQEHVINGLARAGAGTIAMYTIGYLGAKEGWISGSSPNSPSERANKNAENVPQNSVRIGKHWVSLQPFAPITFPLMLGANLWQASDAHPGMSAGQMVGQGIASMGKTLTEQTFLQGLQQTINAAQDPQRYGAQFVTGMVPIPAIVGQVAQGLDQTVRAPQNVPQQIMARIPGLSQRLPPRLDQFGRPVMREGGLPAATLDIFNTRTDKSDPVTRELDRLQVFPGLPGKSVRIAGKSVARTPDEYNQMLQEAGPALHQVLAQTINNPSYQALPEDQQRLVLQKIILNIRAAATQQSKARLVQSGRVPQ